MCSEFPWLKSRISLSDALFNEAKRLIRIDASLHVTEEKLLSPADKLIESGSKDGALECVKVVKEYLDKESSFQKLQCLEWVGFEG